MAKRRRNIPLLVMVTEKERTLICEKMAQYGTRNMGAYLRKMAIDGYVVRLETKELSEMISLLRRSSNNLNQYAKRAHETGSVYAADVDDVRKQFNELWGLAGQIVTRLSRLV